MADDLAGIVEMLQRLAVVLQQDGVAAIPKSSKRPHLVENISVFDFALSQADMKALSALASPNGRIVRPASAPDWD